MFIALLDAVKGGNAILTAGSIHPDIPTINDVGHSLPTDGEVRHCGFGYFIAEVAGSRIQFTGGGAMRRILDENGDWVLSWCVLRADPHQLKRMGYDLSKVENALQEVISCQN